MTSIQNKRRMDLTVQDESWVFIEFDFYSKCHHQSAKLFTDIKTQHLSFDCIKSKEFLLVKFMKIQLKQFKLFDSSHR